MSSHTHLALRAPTLDFDAFCAQVISALFSLSDSNHDDRVVRSRNRDPVSRSVPHPRPEKHPHSHPHLLSYFLSAPVLPPHAMCHMLQDPKEFESFYATFLTWTKLEAQRQNGAPHDRAHQPWFTSPGSPALVHQGWFRGSCRATILSCYSVVIDCVQWDMLQLV